MSRVPLPLGASLLLGLTCLVPACAKQAATVQPLFAIAAAGQPNGSSSTPSGMPKIRFSNRPVPVPAFNLTTVDGAPLSSAKLQGKVLLVNFWATWCGPCREEIPTLVALQEHYRDSLVVVGMSIDERPAREVKQFADQHHMNYPVAIADAALQQAFGGISAVPATFVVNPAGGIVQRHVGLISPPMTEQEIRSLAGLQTVVPVEIVQDTGQVLLANAAYATEIPGIDLKGLTPVQRERALGRLNTDKCTCGCGLTMAQCRINDPSCNVSLPAAQQVVKDIAAGK